MSELELLVKIRENAARKKRTILLPESHDERVLKAAEIITREGIGNVITLGNEETVRAAAKTIGVDLKGVRIIDPEKSEKLSDFSNIFYNQRKHKGVTIEEARETIKRDIFFGAMMLKEGMAHASVAGSTASTGDVMRAGILCIGTKEGISIVSSFFLMVYPDVTYSFGDCAVVPDPMQFNLLISQFRLPITIKFLPAKNLISLCSPSQQKEVQNIN
jgi:phosphate acetyltransferase